MTDSSQDLSGRTVVITGASSGIGRAAAIALAGRGATIGVVGRNPERTRAVAAEVGGQPFIADFDRLNDVRHLARALLTAYPRIDVLANNAGGLVSTRELSADGHERTFQHNHLAPFLLTQLLIERLIESRARVISTASAANLFGSLDLNDLDWANRRYAGGWRAYGTSKLETILFIRELARRTAGTGLTAFSFHPGTVATEFGSNSTSIKLSQRLGREILRLSPEKGAAPLVHLAAAEEVGSPSGTYFDRFKSGGWARKIASNEATAKSLWELSERLVAPTS
jgi:NAD(P)-dependent dehydrogenase (short-subunit alcohol dehydrogenase family)